MSIKKKEALLGVISNNVNTHIWNALIIMMKRFIFYIKSQHGKPTYADYYEYIKRRIKIEENHCFQQWKVLHPLQIMGTTFYYIIAMQYI